ncbi:uncharacterized protein RCO7_11014 [Rhynchosporium graminicola]|uniref:NACHT domain-containing protein n=1 Tax=Rhynchosporium graminicola TaxID=2792576 RepID=A0A1E1LKG0_9HELO|nr:uncharacterized protein RCO7_11014 [Rhynchosporium commune]
MPEFIPCIFPQYVDQSRESNSERASELQIPYEIVLNASEKLLGEEHRETLKEHCFCFFIDGLDELDDAEEEDYSLAVRLRDWTLRRPAIKICVSSREENAFMRTFPSSQRLQLYLLTADNMRKTVENSLENHDSFHEFVLEERKRFVKQIVLRVRGVFLWVKLVLRMLREDLSANQSIEELYRTLKEVPTELGAPYTKMLTTFECKDHQEVAWAIIAVLMAIDPNNLEGICIFQHSYVEDYLRNNRFSEEMATTSLVMSQILSRQNIHSTNQPAFERPRRHRQ